MKILELPIVAIPLDLIALCSYLLFAGFLLHVIIRTIIYQFKKEKQGFNPLKETIRYYNRDTYKFISKKYTPFYLIGFIWGIIIVLPYTPYGSEQIGSLIEKREYKSFYYVNLFPEGEESKNYRVLGLIDSYIDSDYGRQYFLSYVILDNGKELYFEPDEILKLNKKVSLVDKNNKNWFVELTDDRFPIEDFK